MRITQDVVIEPWLAACIFGFLALCVIDLFVTLYKNRLLRDIRSRIDVQGNLIDMVAQRVGVVPPTGYAPEQLEQGADLFQPRPRV
jgi:hypothetical protein